MFLRCSARCGRNEQISHVVQCFTAQRSRFQTLLRFWFSFSNVHGVTGRVSFKALRVITCMAGTHLTSLPERGWYIHVHFHWGVLAGGMFLLTKSHVLKSMQSLLIHLHCLGNAGLQKYILNKKNGCKWFRSLVWNFFATSPRAAHSSGRLWRWPNTKA